MDGSGTPQAHHSPDLLSRYSGVPDPKLKVIIFVLIRD